jgi:hypothetical protein
MPQHESPPISKADRSDSRSLAQFRFGVAVVAHRVGAVPIEIGQAGVEVDTQFLPKTLLQARQGFWSWGRLIDDAGVAVSTVSNPGC